MMMPKIGFFWTKMRDGGRAMITNVNVNKQTRTFITDGSRWLGDAA